MTRKVIHKYSVNFISNKFISSIASHSRVIFTEANSREYTETLKKISFSEKTWTYASEL